MLDKPVDSSIKHLPLFAQLPLVEPGFGSGLCAVPAAIFVDTEVAPSIGVGVVAGQLVPRIINLDQPPCAARARRALADLLAHCIAPGHGRAQRALGAAIERIGELTMRFA